MARIQNTVAAMATLIAFACPGHAAFEDGESAFARGDFALALREWRPLAEQGDARAQNEIGKMYSSGQGVAKDERLAFMWWKRAADQGYARAQYNVGLSFQQGHGVAKDPKEAASWYRKAADQGRVLAQFNLGDLYARGIGVDKDLREAVRWWMKAAEQGHADAQFNVGEAFLNGEGVDTDPVEAVKWYRRAAEQGQVLAQTMMGIAYYGGEGGVAKDLATARRWFSAAAANGDAQAKRYLTILANREARLTRRPGACPCDANALVLSGGGIKGAYQAGAIWYLVHVLGCDFNHFYGTSTGAVTAAFLSQARNHEELKALTNDLVKQYRQMKPEGIAEKRFLGKLRILMPTWLGGVNGLYTLKPLADRLSREIDVKRVNNLTVISASLQTGRMRLTVSDNRTLTDDAVEPDSILNFVLGSASVPVVVEPRNVRFWVRGQMIRQGEDLVIMNSQNFGMRDSACMIRVNRKVTVPCVYEDTKTFGAGDSKTQWTTLLRIPDAGDRERLWSEAEQPYDAADAEDESVHLVLRGGRWSRIKPTLVEFTTLHQLVDGGVTDFLFVGDLAEMRANQVAATAFIVTTGEYAQPPINNREYSGGLSIAEVSLEHFLDAYQFGNLETELKSAAYTQAMAETLDWTERAVEWRKEMVSTEAGRAALSRLESGLSHRFPERPPRYRVRSQGLYPAIFLLMPRLRFFESVFDARPEAIDRALAYGCRLGAGTQAASEVAPQVFRPEAPDHAARCDELPR